MSALPATAPPRRIGRGVLTWLACIALSGAVLCAPFAGLGVAPRSLGATLAFLALFAGLPGLALLARTSWMAGSPLAFAAWCCALGIALQPLWLTPLWLAGELRLAWIVPCVSAAMLILGGRDVATFVEAGMAARPARWWLGACAALAAFTAFAACLGVMYPFSTTPIDVHFATQGSIVRNLEDGWPPMNELLDGVPLSYNYGLHLGLLLLVQEGHADLLQLVARIAPLLFLEAAIVSFLAFGRGVLALPWPALLLAAVAVFWTVGYGPVNAGIYGSVLPAASTYVVSSSAGFVGFFVALRFLGSSVPSGWRAAIAAAALGFCLTAMRGQAGPVFLAVAAFACVVPLPRERRLDVRAVWILLGTAVGVLAALRIYFTMGSGFSGTSWMSVNTTFGWLVQQGDAFTLVHALSVHGIPGWAAGAAGFAVIALMQAKFLAPALVYRLAALRLTDPLPLLLLAATALAGTMATMLTSAPGGSQFSFLHYAALSMALLAASGIARLHALRDGGSDGGGLRPIVPALVVVLALASAWDLASQLWRLRGHWLAGPPRLHALPEVDPLLDRIPSGEFVVPVLRPADYPRGIEAEWNMRRGLRFPLYPPLLLGYAQRETGTRTVLRQRAHAAAAIALSVQGAPLDPSQLDAIEDTLDRPRHLYVIVPRETAAQAGPRLRALASTRAYTLYMFEPQPHGRGR